MQELVFGLTFLQDRSWHLLSFTTNLTLLSHSIPLSLCMIVVMEGQELECFP